MLLRSSVAIGVFTALIAHGGECLAVLCVSRADGRVRSRSEPPGTPHSTGIIEGNVTAQIFWIKAMGHWREGRAPEDPVPGAEAGSHRYVVILPDNGRDPQVTEQCKKNNVNTSRENGGDSCRNYMIR